MPKISKITAVRKLTQRLLIASLTIILLQLLPFTANADSELNLAPKAGANAATLAHDNRANRYGFSGGISGYLQWHLSKRFSLASQMEFLYTPRGAEIISNGETLGESREHYFDIMVAARPEMQLGPWSVYLLLGGGVNFLVSANKEIASSAKQDITNDLHRIDVALLGGVGAAFHLSHMEPGGLRLSTVFLEARHDLGLIDTDAVNGGYKNRTSSLMLGLSFMIGGSPAPDANQARPGN